MVEAPKKILKLWCFSSRNPFNADFLFRNERNHTNACLPKEGLDGAASLKTLPAALPLHRIAVTHFFVVYAILAPSIVTHSNEILHDLPEVHWHGMND
jgi:hypothetical protein